MMRLLRMSIVEKSRGATVMLCPICGGWDCGAWCS